MPDNLERRIVGGAEPIGQRAPDLGRLVDDIIEQVIFVQRPDIGKLLGLIPQDRLIVFFVVGFEKDRLDLGLLLVWPLGSAKLERADCCKMATRLRISVGAESSIAWKHVAIPSSTV